MKNIVKKHGERGFSLVELMIVVGIIGVLATLALPRFKQFQAKAKMGEAKNILSHLYTLEQTYTLDNNQYLAMGSMGAGLSTLSGSNTCTATSVTGAPDLGFTIDPCVSNAPLPRFSYSITTSNGNSNFLATALTGAGAVNRVCPGNGNLAIKVTITDGNVMNDAANGTFGKVCAN